MKTGSWDTEDWINGWKCRFFNSVIFKQCTLKRNDTFISIVQNSETQF